MDGGGFSFKATLKYDLMATAKKKITRLPITSPRGVAAFAWVDKPDAKFDPTKPKYKITLLLDEGPEADAFEEKIVALGKQAAEKDGVKLKKNFSLPIKRYEDDEEDKRKPEFEGKVRFEFKANAKSAGGEDLHGPRLMDAAKAPLPASVKIFSGDVVKVGAKVSAYETFGSGLSLQLNAVQLLEKNNAGGGYDYFDEEDGYTAPESPGDDDKPPFETSAEDDDGL